jgi:deuterolysin
MQYLTHISMAIAAFSTAVSSRSLGLVKRTSPLEVTLTPTGNTNFVASITNTGDTDLNLLTYGSILDNAPVQKVNVFASSTNVKVPFVGILRSVSYTNLDQSAFLSLPAGATYTTTLDAATVHDFTSSGSYTFVAEGALAYAEGTSTELVSAIPYESNTVEVEVDSVAAKRIRRAIPQLSLMDRSIVQSGCKDGQDASVKNALSNCQKLATAAATAATSGNAAKFNEYFKTTDSSVRKTVAARLTAVAKECGSSTSGATKYYCYDYFNQCQSNILAYTVPAQNILVNCPIYYTALPNLSTNCHAQDETTTTLHEMTHAPAVFSPGTEDYGYGYAAATALSSAQAVLNADTYAMYANGELFFSYGLEATSAPSGVIEARRSLSSSVKNSKPLDFRRSVVA